MKISAKTQYGLAAMIYIAAREDGSPITVLQVSEQLDISKIYLEQVFSLLKRAGLVQSVKGAQGGYRLARPAEDISAYDILNALDTALLEEAAPALRSCRAQGIQEAVQNLVLTPLGEGLQKFLQGISLLQLCETSATNPGAADVNSSTV